jgi:hypothetical protein
MATAKLVTSTVGKKLTPSFNLLENGERVGGIFLKIS